MWLKKVKTLAEEIKKNQKKYVVYFNTQQRKKKVDGMNIKV